MEPGVASMCQVAIQLMYKTIWYKLQELNIFLGTYTSLFPYLLYGVPIFISDMDDNFTIQDLSKLHLYTFLDSTLDMLGLARDWPEEITIVRILNIYVCFTSLLANRGPTVFSNRLGFEDLCPTKGYRHY